MSDENGYVKDSDASDDDADIGESGGADAVVLDAANDSTERELADQRDRYLRLAAEYDNFR